MTTKYYAQVDIQSHVMNNEHNIMIYYIKDVVKL